MYFLDVEGFIAFLISAAIHFWINIHHNSLPTAEIYDFIVVGAGPGGAVVASRLSEKYSVLLVEAGGDSNFYTDIPYIGYDFANTPLDYKFLTEPTPDFGWAYVYNQSFWRGGKATGGSTIHNGMVANRGDSASFDRWCEKEGAHGWCYHHVLPYFKKMESYVNPLADTRFRGKNGPLRTEDLPYRTPIADTFLRAAVANGIPIGDYNGPEKQVAGVYQMTSNRGPRVTAANAYLWRSKRSNLQVATFSKAEKVLIEQTKNELRAVGVRFRTKKGTKSVFAKKEIILAAGAIETPKLLMLSGIGPQDCLKEAGIPVIKELPVGHNLIDHPLASFVFNLNNNGDFVRNKTRDVTFENWKRYLRKERGPLSLAGAEQAVIHFKSSVSFDEVDLQVDVVNSNTLNGGSRKSWTETLNGRPEIWDNIFERDSGKNQVSFRVFLNAPRCRGSLRLNPRDPNGAPIIGGRYLCHPDDVKAVLEGAKFVFKLSQFPEFQRYGMEQAFYIYPGCEGLSGDSALLCYILATTSNTFHVHGTCRMGPPGTSVVDVKLKVHDIKGVRIADTSFAPAPYTGNTQLLSYLVGEIAADLITSEWS